MPSLAPYAASSYAPFSPSSAAHTPSAFVSPVSSVSLSGAEWAGEFSGARVLRAVAEPIAREQCRTLLPQASPIEVQINGRTVMHLYSEPDRVGFLKDNRANALWMEMLDAVRAVDGCPAETSSAAVTSDIEARMSCLGIGVAELWQSEATPPPSVEESVVSEVDGPREARAPLNTSEFPSVAALALPSVYIREAGFEPGTVAALEYDLGWRALAPSWQTVMPVIDEALWAANPNPELFRTVGRAVLPHLATTSSGKVMDELCERILSFHMHAGGLANCLTNVTQVVERTGSDGQPRSVAAIEIVDFIRDCAGPDWRQALITRPGEDALTRRREACARPSTFAPMPPTIVEDTERPDDAMPITDLRR
ncbi:hypothetical protein [Pandoraea sp. NPDC087047]|uniref:hypothetical protein n=1 Tax=Pandoraea sp. NPDC087047 TaxID=3364390 RepID=UPI003817FA40